MIQLFCDRFEPRPWFELIRNEFRAILFIIKKEIYRLSSCEDLEAGELKPAEICRLSGLFNLLGSAYGRRILGGLACLLLEQNCLIVFQKFLERRLKPWIEVGQRTK